MCGLTTGGREECDWDCDVAFFGQFFGPEVTEIANPECLRDCFKDVPCVGMILDDPTCTPEKEAALRDPECIKSVFRKQPFV